MMNPNQMREGLLFVCSYMADQTNLGSAAVRARESEEESSVGDVLA